jgi:hypothetical protein
MKIREKDGLIKSYVVEEVEDGEMWLNYLSSEYIETPEFATSIVMKKNNSLITLQLSTIRYFSESEMVDVDVYTIDKKGNLYKITMKIPKLWLEDDWKYRSEVRYRMELEGERVQQEQATQEIGTRWEIGKVYYNVEQFNKTKLGWAYVRYDIDQFVRDGKRYRLMILHDYRTTRGNHTTSFIILEEPLPQQITIQVPREYMGLLIGKGGSNIKAVQQKYGIKINLQAQG